MDKANPEVSLMDKIKHRLRSIKGKFKKKVEIPSYHVKRAILLGYKDKFNIGTLVETGTFLGDTVEFFRHKLDMVYSIELSDELAAKAIKRFAGIANVKIIQGDSGEILADIVKQISSPALFWLDGHYSSEFYVNDEFIRTARSEKDTPILKELGVLLNDHRQHVILVDDARMFTGEGDYPTLKAISNLVKQSRHSFEVFVDRDIINIIPAIRNS
jgi:hypothetical protein